MTAPRTHLLGASIVLHTGELFRTVCGRYLDMEPVAFAAVGELPSCPRCLFRADEERREARP